MARPETRRELPVLALDVVNDGRLRPGQQRRDDKPHTFAGPGWRKAKDVFWTIMTKVVPAPSATYDPVLAEEPGCPHLLPSGPARGSVGFHILGLSRPPHRHSNRGGDRNEAPRSRNVSPLDKDRRRIGVEDEPP